MPVASAPGKVYLFGEHAVVYGEPAIPCAINRRVTVDVQPRADEYVHIETDAVNVMRGTVTVPFDDSSDPALCVPTAQLTKGTAYVIEALQQVFSYLNEGATGFDITIESELPVGAGLGSSAAVSVATVTAAAHAFEAKLSDEMIAQLAYQTEQAVQSGRASRADTFCATMGGAVRVEGDDCQSISAPPLSFTIGFDGTAGDTGKLVQAVEKLVDTYVFGDTLIAAIGSIVREGEDQLAANDRRAVGSLMNINHGLLAALGVSTASLDEMVWAARSGGAAGAKLTGAGGGGCIVALGNDPGITTALSVVASCDHAFSTDIATEGIMRPEEP